jgi:hypothetical protein
MIFLYYFISLKFVVDVVVFFEIFFSLSGGRVDPRLFIAPLDGYGLGIVANFTSYEQTPLFTIPRQFVITAPDVVSHYPEWNDLQEEDSVIGLYLAMTKFHPKDRRKSSKKYAFLLSSSFFCFYFSFPISF